MCFIWGMEMGSTNSLVCISEGCVVGYLARSVGKHLRHVCVCVCVCGGRDAHADGHPVRNSLRRGDGHDVHVWSGTVARLDWIADGHTGCQGDASRRGGRAALQRIPAATNKARCVHFEASGIFSCTVTLQSACIGMSADCGFNTHQLSLIRVKID